MLMLLKLIGKETRGRHAVLRGFAFAFPDEMCGFATRNAALKLLHD
jgi:hypothetical protein